MRVNKAKVVIIGAGAAGLFAAKKLIDSGQYGPKDIIILEAQDYVGGRIKTIFVNDGPLETGAQWIHGRGDNPVWKFVLENNISVAEIANRDGKGNFMSQSGDIPPKEILHSTLNFLQEVHESVYDVLDDEGQLKDGIPSSVGKYFKQRFEKWLDQLRENESAELIKWRQRIFNWRILWENCDCGCNDLDDNSIYTFAKYEEFEGGDACLSKGYYSFVETIQKLIRGKVQILLNKEVIKVKKDDKSEVISIECSDGSLYECNTSIVTVSLGVLKASLNMFDYETIKWPSKVLRAIHNIGFGTISFIKIEFEEQFWDKKNPGVMILRDSDTFNTFDYKDDDPWYNYVYGFDSVLHQPNILMGWMSGEESRAMEMLSDKEIGENCIDLLKRVMSKSNIQAPIRMKNIYVSRWYQNRFCRGTYSYATTACVEKGIHHADLLEPVRYSSGRIALMLAGEATSDNCTGTVHGALMSGELQASKILELNRDSELKK
ncbi:spermine oxidase [Lepeophtheirus salmonis]|uniref:spermine oxidase n=1 Tax=Lepeophtheirus salmonis TaxID=72036 RepID=UPI001AE560AD|nr:spermine oxidase-like [Lepeophtheirus salmonis]